MGQYFIAVVQATKYNEKRKFLKKQFIIKPFYSKLLAHSGVNDFEPRLVANLMHQLYVEGWSTQLVWLGDYHQENFGCKKLYEKLRDKVTPYEMRYVNDETFVKFKGVKEFSIAKDYRYLINSEKCEYIDFKKYLIDDNLDCLLHPIVMLTADGNGKGGGDYFNQENWRDIGRWKYDTIIVSDELIQETNVSSRFELKEIDVKFSSDY